MKQIFILAFVFSTSVFAQVSHLSVFRNVKINICGEMMDGCASYVTIEPRRAGEQPLSLLLDMNYPEAQKFIKSHRQVVDRDNGGTVTALEVMGTVVKEKGHFPNPMAEFEVLKPIVIVPVNY
jgi:hypothetical protein